MKRAKGNFVLEPKYQNPKPSKVMLPKAATENSHKEKQEIIKGCQKKKIQIDKRREKIYGTHKYQSEAQG